MQDPCAHSRVRRVSVGIRSTTRSDPQLDQHIPKDAMSFPGALRCSEGFLVQFGFSRSHPGMFELVVPNAAPACFLVLIVKPWQQHSQSGLQKSCRIRCLPDRWALLRGVTPLTTSDSSCTPFPALLCTLCERGSAQRQRQEPGSPRSRACPEGSAFAGIPAPQICSMLFPCPPPPTSLPHAGGTQLHPWVCSELSPPALDA